MSAARVALVAFVLGSMLCVSGSAQATMACEFTPRRVQGYWIRAAIDRDSSCGSKDMLLTSPSGSWTALLSDYYAPNLERALHIAGDHVYWIAARRDGAAGVLRSEIRSLRLHDRVQRVVYRSPEQRIVAFALARDQRQLIAHLERRTLAWVSLPDGESRVLFWNDPYRQPGYNQAIQLFGWSSDSQWVWFSANCRGVYRAHVMAPDAELIAEYDPPWACGELNPDLGLLLSSAEDVLLLTDVFADQHVTVSRAWWAERVQWTGHGGFTVYATRPWHVSNARALLRWSAWSLWALALGFGLTSVWGLRAQQRKSRQAVGAMASALGGAIFGNQLCALWDAFLGPLVLSREPTTSLVLHNELSLGLFVALQAYAVASRLSAELRRRLELRSSGGTW